MEVPETLAIPNANYNAFYKIIKQDPHHGLLYVFTVNRLESFLQLSEA